MSKVTWRAYPFTTKSDQYQISPAASPEILRHTVWRTWLSIAYLEAKLLYYQFSLPSLIKLSLQGWENLLFELESERVKTHGRRMVGLLHPELFASRYTRRSNTDASGPVLCAAVLALGRPLPPADVRLLLSPSWTRHLYVTSLETVLGLSAGFTGAVVPSVPAHRLQSISLFETD